MRQFFPSSLVLRPLTFIMLVLFCAKIKAQNDTTFYDKYYKVTRRNKAETFKVVIPEPSAYTSADKDKATEKYFYKNGQIMLEQHYSAYSEKTLDGKLKKWYGNGQLKADMNYKKGIVTGELTTYWRNGKLRRKDEYNDSGKLVTGNCYDSTGAVIPYFNYIKAPYFEYYKGDLDRYCFEHMKYPHEANSVGIGGKVVLSFMVEKDGSVSHFNIAKSSGNRDLDNAALDVFYDMPLWEPGTEDGDPVRMPYEYSMKFSPGW